MSAHAAPAPGGARTLVIRGTPYPILLPKLRDPRLHLAATITSLQVLGQVAFHFRLSIAQILVSLLTCAVLEVAIAARRQRVIMWPASALLTGNGVAFILRVPGTHHGDWWSLRGWWIFMGTAAVSLLSKHLVQWRGNHVFNPSNFGLVLCFLLLGRTRSEPLDFWWGPMSAWMVLALLIILAGGFAILGRLHLLRLAVSFWLAFAAGIALLAAAGHEMTARWHLGPISGFDLWWVLVTSPEVLVFLFFMITDPKTAPRAPRARVAYAIAIGLLASLMIAPVRTEWATKVALLLALFIVCAAGPLVAALPLRKLVTGRARLALPAAAAVAYAAVLLVAGGASHTGTAAAAATGKHVDVAILPSKGVQTQLDQGTAQLIAQDLASEVPAAAHERVSLWLEPGGGQDPPIAVARLKGKTYKLKQVGGRGWTLTAGSPAPTSVALPRVPALHGYALSDVAQQVGASFTQQSFRFGVTPDPTAMMGGGLCWLDYDNDGWLDLFAVNSYTDAQYAQWSERGGAPTGALFHNVHGRFVNVTKVSGTGLPLRGDGCVAADFDGDGRTDLFVSTAVNDVLFWNNGDGTFTEGARKADVVSFGWHAGAAVADVNGDGRPDLFVAGYANLAEPIPNSVSGFPSNVAGVRDELFLNEGGRRFKEVAPQAGIDPKPYGHGLGAEFLDVNGDGRPDLYVANDEDPNALYLNEPGGPLGFHFVQAQDDLGVADRNAGMGIAAGDLSGDGRAELYVTNSRGQGNAAYESTGGRFLDVRKRFAVGVNPTGWGDSFIDLRNSGRRELVIANGAIPVTNVARDASPLQVLAPSGGGWIDSGLLRGTRVNGRGLAAGDFDNDGRVDVAVNTVGGKLLLLHNTSPAGNWVEVLVKPFSPGAVVTAVGSDGRRQVQVVRAGSSYLSSEDPRVHFGFGKATVASLTVRYPDGKAETLHPKTNAIVAVSR